MDLLRRVFVPVENKDGYFVLGTVLYRRNPLTQVIRRVIAKVRGKSARRADKKARRALRLTEFRDVSL